MHVDIIIESDIWWSGGSTHVEEIIEIFKSNNN